MSLFSRLRILILATIAAAFCAPCIAGNPTITSGFNLGLPGTTLNVPFNTTTNSYAVNEALAFVPSAGPITKNFGSPVFVTGAPILLDALQPLPFLVNEDFSLQGTSPPSPNNSVRDWHEIIITPGWQWVVPLSPAQSPFAPGTSLITRDGLPWASTPISGPTPTPANQIHVKFDPIDVGHVLDIHKALLFVGTETNRIWGDGPGETTIVIVEYPTPEPSSLVLAILAGAALLLSRKRWRR